MKKTSPSKPEIALMAPFVGLTLERIHVPITKEEFASAAAEIKVAGIVGFDTESKPTFAVGDVSEGPHVVQFALHDKAYLFQPHRAEGLPFLIELLQSEQVIKVGFGLKSDSGHIFKKFGINFGGVVDLNTVFSMRGYQKEMGVRNAVGLMFKQRFAKSRKITTTDWSQRELSRQQMLYAANDAYAALKVFEALNLPREALPIMGASQPEQNPDKADLSE
jgi:ribonuclease D